MTSHAAIGLLVVSCVLSVLVIGAGPLAETSVADPTASNLLADGPDAVDGTPDDDTSASVPLPGDGAAVEDPRDGSRMSVLVGRDAWNGSPVDLGQRVLPGDAWKNEGNGRGPAGTAGEARGEGRDARGEGRSDEARDDDPANPADPGGRDGAGTEPDEEARGFGDEGDDDAEGDEEEEADDGGGAGDDDEPDDESEGGEDDDEDEGDDDDEAGGDDGERDEEDDDDEDGEIEDEDDDGVDDDDEVGDGADRESPRESRDDGDEGADADREATDEERSSDDRLGPDIEVGLGVDQTASPTPSQTTPEESQEGQSSEPSDEPDDRDDDGGNDSPTVGSEEGASDDTGTSGGSEDSNARAASGQENEGDDAGADSDDPDSDGRANTNSGSGSDADTDTTPSSRPTDEGSPEGSQAPPATDVEVDEGRESADQVGTPGPPRLNVESVEANRSTLPEGESVRLTVTVANTGASEGARELELRLFDEVVDQRTASVPANASRRVSFVRQITSPGTYEVSVADAETSITVTGEETPSSDGPPPQETPGFGVLALLAALAIGALLARRGQ